MGQFVMTIFNATADETLLREKLRRVTWRAHNL